MWAVRETCFLQPAICTMAVYMTQCHLGDTQDDIRIRFNRLTIFSWLTVTHTMPRLGIAVVGKILYMAFCFETGNSSFIHINCPHMCCRKVGYSFGITLDWPTTFGGYTHTLDWTLHYSLLQMPVCTKSTKYTWQRSFRSWHGDLISATNN